MQSIKEHNLKANHNSTMEEKQVIFLYAIYQRTQSESKSQLVIVWRHNPYFCMQSIKEHNLKANHNGLMVAEWTWSSVCNLSKNTIWKQITTSKWGNCKQSVLYAIYQRTQSESKSQRYLGIGLTPLICMQSIKEHNLKANHNVRTGILREVISVCNLSKNTIWKQITTADQQAKPHPALYAIYQRTQSESKSQPEQQAIEAAKICMQSIKEHNLKANHNSLSHVFPSAQSVCNLSKNTIWKQITTCWRWCGNCGRLYAIYQRTQSESKSQLVLVTSTKWLVCMQSIKEHNLKANHNSCSILLNGVWSVCNLSKNTIWKQITTGGEGITTRTHLYAIYQRTQSESKSQQRLANVISKFICMQSIKEHNLKANHNS